MTAGGSFAVVGPIERCGSGGQWAERAIAWVRRGSAASIPGAPHGAVQAAGTAAARA